MLYLLYMYEHVHIYMYFFLFLYTYIVSYLTDSLFRFYIGSNIEQKKLKKDHAQ